MSWRAKLGIIYPADGALDHEYWELVPRGVTVHITRMEIPQEEGTLEALEAQARGTALENAIANLTIIRPDAIGYACTSASFLHGIGGDLDIIQRMEAASGVPCTTATTAAVRALHTLGSKKISIITPYPDEINVRLKKFMEDTGFQVVNFKGMGLYREIFAQPVGAVYQLAKEADSSEADTIFSSCTNFRTVEVLQILEKDLDKPFLSANQAIVWDLLRLAGVIGDNERYGTLYQREMESRKT